MQLLEITKKQGLWGRIWDSLKLHAVETFTMLISIYSNKFSISNYSNRDLQPLQIFCNSYIHSSCHGTYASTLSEIEFRSEKERNICSKPVARILQPFPVKRGLTLSLLNK